jgi:hypothetical protein
MNVEFSDTSKSSKMSLSAFNKGDEGLGKKTSELSVQNDQSILKEVLLGLNLSLNDITVKIEKTSITNLSFQGILVYNLPVYFCPFLVENNCFFVRSSTWQPTALILEASV